MSKTCTKCGVVKPLDDFHRDKRSPDGRRSDCKECVREYKHRYHEENRDKERERKHRYREENRDKVRKCQRRYHEENRDILNQGNKIRQVQNTRISNLLASKKGVPYSPEEDALILADNGMTIYQKAIELGRTYASVKARKQHLRARANQRGTPFGELETTTHERGTDATAA